MLYWPLPLVTVCHVAPLFGFVTMTLTLGMTAAVESVTTPVKDPRLNWASAIEAVRISTSATYSWVLDMESPPSLDWRESIRRAKEIQWLYWCLSSHACNSVQAVPIAPMDCFIDRARPL